MVVQKMDARPGFDWQLKRHSFIFSFIFSAFFSSAHSWYSVCQSSRSTTTKTSPYSLSPTSCPCCRPSSPCRFTRPWPSLSTATCTSGQWPRRMTEDYLKKSRFGLKNTGKHLSKLQNVEHPIFFKFPPFTFRKHQLSIYCECVSS